MSKRPNQIDEWGKSRYAQGRADRMAQNCVACRHYHKQGVGSFGNADNYQNIVFGNCRNYNIQCLETMTCPQWQAKEKGGSE